MNNPIKIGVDTAKRVFEKQIKPKLFKLESGCWHFAGATSKSGYGIVSVSSNGKRQFTSPHRISYLTFKGEIPINSEVCHTCDRHICCNPDHLYLATHKQNQ